MTCLIVVILIGVLVVVAIAALIYLGSQIDPLAPPPGTTIGVACAALDTLAA